MPVDFLSLLLSNYGQSDNCVKNYVKKELACGSYKPESREEMLMFSLTTDSHHPTCRTVHK